MSRPKVLPDDLATLRTAGVSTLISLLEPSEAETVGLKHEGQHCTALGLTFLNHPIRDMHLPDQIPFADFTKTLATRLCAGQHIAIHCHASIGRSGMLACALLGHFGFDAPTALNHVSKMRGTAVPDTPAQTAFIHKIMATQHI